MLSTLRIHNLGMQGLTTCLTSSSSSFNGAAKATLAAGIERLVNAMCSYKERTHSSFSINWDEWPQVEIWPVPITKYFYKFKI